jgi:segregation and condensation protein A
VTTVARFLALLELFREGAVGFEQVAALGELNVRWTGSTEGDLDISDEFDSPDSAPGAPAASEDQ